MGIALVTGASAGLGIEFAKLLAQDGHSVVLVARRMDRLEKLAEQLRAMHPEIKAWSFACDLSRPQAAQEVFVFTQKLNLKIDFLINNAGFGTNGVFASQPLEKELQQIDLNIRSLVAFTHLFLQGMLARRSGRILNLGSTAGFQPGPYMATYYASKAFVNSFSEALAFELQGTGVSCTVLAPGPTVTEFGAVSGLDKSKLFKGSAASAQTVAEVGYQAMMAGESLCIQGLKNNMLVQSLRVSPRRWVRKITARLNRV